MPEKMKPLSNPPWHKRLSDEQSAELEIIRSKYEMMRKEWDCQQETLKRLEGEVFKLREQLQTQSYFCAALGSILGHLVWKSSRVQQVVELLLTSNKMTEFFCVVSGTLVSFMGTYIRQVPDVRCNETQFILSLCGIVANVAAVPEGRQFIVTDSNGKEMIEQILKVLPILPPVTGDPLKKILLMVLYNISINQAGLCLIQEEKNLLIALSQVICADRSELKILGLRLLESITFEIPNTSSLLKILHQIPKNKIEVLSESADAEIRQYASSIMGNIRKAELALGFLIEHKSLEAKKQELLNDMYNRR